MSNVNKFAIHNCNHLMLEQTGRWFGHKGHEWSNQIKHQSISRVTHAEALCLFLYQLTFPSPDIFPSLPLSLLLSPALEMGLLRILLSRVFWVRLNPESMITVKAATGFPQRIAISSCRSCRSGFSGPYWLFSIDFIYLFIFSCFACFPTA